MVITYRSIVDREAGLKMKNNKVSDTNMANAGYMAKLQYCYSDSK